MLTDRAPFDTDTDDYIRHWAADRTPWPNLRPLIYVPLRTCRIDGADTAEIDCFADGFPVRRFKRTSPSALRTQE